MKRLTKDISFLFCWSASVGFALVIVLALNVPPTFGQTEKSVVDLNSASEKELEGLPGIDAAMIKKIIANRPYKSVDELSKAGLSAKEIEALKPLVGVGAEPPVAKPGVTPPKARRGHTAPREYEKQ